LKAPAAGKLSEDPAIGGTTSTKAKARIKLSVRINLPPSPTQVRRFVGQLDTSGLFPDICTKSGKWFRRGRELFRRRGCDETLSQKDQ